MWCPMNCIEATRFLYRLVRQEASGLMKPTSFCTHSLKLVQQKLLKCWTHLFKVLLWNFFSASAKHNGGGATWMSIGIGVFPARHHYQSVWCILWKQHWDIQIRFKRKMNHGFLFLLNWLLKPLACILTLRPKFKGCINPGRGTFRELPPPQIKRTGGHCSWGMQRIMYAGAHFPLSISSLTNKEKED